MAQDINRDLKEIAQNIERRATEAVLRWKYRKEGMGRPDQTRLEAQSRRITEQAHDIISRRGKALLRGIKEALRKDGAEGDGKD